MTKRPLALILCGGKGERMKPWSIKRHKCLVGLASGRALFGHHLRMARDHGFDVAAKVPAAWASEFRSVAEFEQVKCRFLVERGEPAETGFFLRAFAGKTSFERLLVVYGDTWHDSKWWAMAAGIRDRTALSVVPLADGEQRRGMVRLDSDPGDGHLATVRGVDESGRDKRLVYHQCGMVVMSREAALLGRGDLMRDTVPCWLGRKLPVLAFGQSVHLGEPGLTPPVDCGDVGRYAAFVADRYSVAFGSRVDRASTAAAAIAILRAKRVMVGGNGGSYAIAAHTAQDWLKIGRVDATPIGSPEVLTAFGNDYGYGRSLSYAAIWRGLGSGDVLVLFSVSGTSPNVAEALRAADDAKTIGVLVTADDGGGPGIPDSTVVVRAPFPRSLVQECEDWFSVWMHGLARAMQGLAPWHGWENT